MVFFRPSMLWACPVAFSLAVPGLAQEMPQALDVDGYVRIVLRAHPAERVGSSLEQGARAERKAARLLPDPGFEYTWGSADPAGGPSGRASESGLAVTQAIPWPGALRAGRRAGDRAAERLLADSTAVRWEIEVAARRAFTRLVTARSLVEIDQATEEDARSLRDLVGRRTELGDTRESDRIRSSVEWMRQRRLLDSSRREADAAEVALRTLAVDPLPRPLRLDARDSAELGTVDASALAERLARLNPRVMAARAETERHRALLGQARQARVPDLGVTLFRDEELDKTSSGVSLAVRVPLWNANRGEIARAEAAASLAEAEAARLTLDLAAELADRLKDLDVASTQSQALARDILPAAAASLQLARRSYEEGETSLLDLLDAQRTFRETQREAALSRSALALAVSDIQRLVGPDFDPWRRQ